MYNSSLLSDDTHELVLLHTSYQYDNSSRLNKSGRFFPRRRSSIHWPVRMVCDTIVAYHLSGCDIHTRDERFVSRSKNTLKISGNRRCDRQTRSYTSGLPNSSIKSHLRLLICNPPPTSWIRDGVGQERVLMPFDRSTVSTFNPYHCFSQCSPPSAPRRQEPYVG